MHFIPKTIYNTHYGSLSRIGFGGNHKEILGIKPRNSKAVASIFKEEYRMDIPIMQHYNLHWVLFALRSLPKCYKGYYGH